MWWKSKRYSEGLLMMLFLCFHKKTKMATIVNMAVFQSHHGIHTGEGKVKKDRELTCSTNIWDFGKMKNEHYS